MMRRAIAMAMLVGCATTGGKLGAAGTAIFTVAAVLAFDPCLDVTITTDDGTYSSHCGSNVAPAVLLGLAAAAAATGIGFELAHLAAGGDPPRPPPAAPPPPAPERPQAEREVPPALSYADARELVRRFVVDRELRLDGRDASSHFDRGSGAWIFEWLGDSLRVTLSVDVTQSVKGTRCDSTDCSPIP